MYEVQDQKGGRRAVKVVNKASIRTKKNKTKVGCGAPPFLTRLSRGRRRRKKRCSVVGRFGTDEDCLVRM